MNHYVYSFGVIASRKLRLFIIKQSIVRFYLKTRYASIDNRNYLYDLLFILLDFMSSCMFHLVLTFLTRDDMICRIAPQQQ